MNKGVVIIGQDELQVNIENLQSQLS